MYIPTKKAFYDLSPEQFEVYSLDLLREQCNNIENVIIEHNKLIKTFDGNYQIDGYIEFTIMGIRYKTLVECKHYKQSISRAKVELLYGRIKSLGAHKGILISTSNFQKGALDYAKVHGIALIQLTESSTEIERRDFINTISMNGRKPFNYDKPYASVYVQSSNKNSITCKYLSKSNLLFKEFILDSKKS